MFLYITKDQIPLLIDSLRSSIQSESPFPDEDSVSMFKRKVFAEVFIEQIQFTQAIAQKAEEEASELDKRNRALVEGNFR